MKTFSIGALIAAAAALGISILCTFTLDNALSWTDRVNLIFDPASAESFDAYYFAFGTLPRFAAAAIGGALLGLVGSLLQQLTQNPMTSPLTLGTSSGGWLAVVLISAFFPAAAGAWLSLGAFAGALAAFGLILLIAGPRGMTGVALIIAGMVVNLLFGAIATAVVLLRAQFVENVFLWGAGDLAHSRSFRSETKVLGLEACPSCPSSVCWRHWASGSHRPLSLRPGLSISRDSLPPTSREESDSSIRALSSV